MAIDSSVKIDYCVILIFHSQIWVLKLQIYEVEFWFSKLKESLMEIGMPGNYCFSK